MFASRISTQNKDNHMKKNPIKLEDLDRKHPFVVPDGYFDNLPSEILSKLPVVKEHKPLVTWSWKRSLALSGAFSLLLALVWVTFPKRQGPVEHHTLGQISDEAIVEYLQHQNISYYDLSEEKSIQRAFATDSTVMNYLDGFDDAIIREQILTDTAIQDELI